jgi:hypothetical protein
MNRIAVVASLALTACGGLAQRADMPRPPFCVVGGSDPVVTSMDDYGSTYTADMQRGPAPAAPDSHLVPEAQARPDCEAPPWWNPPEPRAGAARKEDPRRSTLTALDGDPMRRRAR